jgi:hypothetical protein
MRFGGKQFSPPCCRAKLAEDAARLLGKTEIIINAHPTSLAFYLANGHGPRRMGRRRTAAANPRSGGKAIAVIKASRRSPAEGASSPTVSLPSQMRKSSPIPAIKGSLNCLPLLFR